MSLWHSGDYCISTDKTGLDIDVIHRFLVDAYWSKDRPRAVVQRSIDHAVCFGLYCKSRQVGFARVITDRATFAYIADLFVLPEHRGKGLGKRLMDCIMGHTELQGLKRWLLVTADAHGLYERYGFTRLASPESLMERMERMEKQSIRAPRR